MVISNEVDHDDLKPPGWIDRRERGSIEPETPDKPCGKNITSKPTIFSLEKDDKLKDWPT